MSEYYKAKARLLDAELVQQKGGWFDDLWHYWLNSGEVSEYSYTTARGAYIGLLRFRRKQAKQ